MNVHPTVTNTLAYAKGNEKERFSPITGDRYPAGKNHNSATLEVESDETVTYLKVPNHQGGQGGKYMNNRRNNKGKFIKRSSSAYAKDNKGKEKDSQGSGYKGKNFDVNFQANKPNNANATQSSSKDKA